MSIKNKIDAAVIGAGISGLWACNKLRRAGLKVALIDKSRGLGGRMATRRAGALQFDHGVQFFTARTDAFSALVDSLMAQGLSAPWFNDRHVVTPRMSAIGHSLLDDEEPLYLNRRVSRLHHKNDGWVIEFEDPEHNILGNGKIKNLVLAVPAPQAIDMIPDEYTTFKKLTDVEYAPCWTLMLAVKTPLQLDNMYVEFSDGHALRSISTNSSKPGRKIIDGLHTFVVHASSTWSIANLECDTETVGSKLLDIISDELSLRMSPTYMATHLWRFAEVTRAAGVPFLWDSKISLGACGDWCHGSRVELAFASGDALADKIILSYN